MERNNHGMTIHFLSGAIHASDSSPRSSAPVAMPNGTVMPT